MKFAADKWTFKIKNYEYNFQSDFSVRKHPLIFEAVNISSDNTCIGNSDNLIEFLLLTMASYLQVETHYFTHFQRTKLTSFKSNQLCATDSLIRKHSLFFKNARCDILRVDQTIRNKLAIS